MKNFGHRILIIVFLFFAFNASAIVVPNSSAKQVAVSQKLGLKEKSGTMDIAKKSKKTAT